MQGIPRHAIAVPLMVAALAAAAAVALWTSLRQDHDTRVGNVAEAVSYAARSELARRLVVQFRAFRDLGDFWATFARLPRNQWAGDAVAGLLELDGVDSIAWSELDGPRFFTTGDALVLDHEPTDAEWVAVQDVLDAAHAATTETVLGPRLDDDGHAVFHYFRPVRRGSRLGVLVSAIDAHDQLEALLVDEAPGYDLRVSCCDDTLLYERGAVDAQLPQASSGGWIEPIEGMLWRVDVIPSDGLVAQLRSWAIDAVLVVGLIMAALLGAVVYENRRARGQAAAARKAEQDVRVLNRDLENRVAMRTSDLNEALTDLNTINLSVSHDLRAPLNTINLLVFGMRYGHDEDGQTAKLFDGIAHSVERMAGIADRLLGFSRAASFECRIERVDMRALAGQVVEEQTPDGFDGEVVLGDLPDADADATMAHILLTNLVANAIRHGKRDGVAQRIEIGCADRDGLPAYFVRDNGPGVDAASAAELFKPSRAPRNGGQGLGLGLAIAARIVRRHGGRIWVESEPGRGAAFSFSLQRESAGPGSAGAR